MVLGGCLERKAAGLLPEGAQNPELTIGFTRKLSKGLDARSTLDRIANRRRTRLSREAIRATWLHSLLREELERKLRGLALG